MVGCVSEQCFLKGWHEPARTHDVACLLYSHRAPDHRRMKTAHRMKRWIIKPLDFGNSFHVSRDILMRFRLPEAMVRQALSRSTPSTVMETQYSGDTVILIFPDGTGPALLSAMIAGIPLNRVHELNYRPGEIRLDINVKSTKALLNSGTLSSEDYKTIVAEGRQELKRLRSMKPEEVISVKDRKLEEDRLEMEAAARQRETKRRAKDEQDQLARETRAREIEEDRQRRREEQGLSVDGSEDNNPVLIGVGAVGASAAAAALFSGGPEDDKKASDAGDKPVEVSNAAATSLPDPRLDVEFMERPLIYNLGDRKDGPLPHGDEDYFMPPVFASRNETDGLTPFGSDGEDARQRINGDRLATFPSPRKPRDPVKAAEQAMKEYMESDDGASEWLQMMSDIMLEEDDDDDYTDEEPQGLRP